ncbi:hypothetical protein M433DRAFT_67804 [Acidomyces richmondensis BFW]|nr:MAG: hypothetical protein FE78DRAFT_149188 [Acidomyces sp. 'richmondensis']KYG45206.1 hypothetical protein M433DRAFT_67804 [Acidomyces richmondensis BFW]
MPSYIFGTLPSLVQRRVPVIRSLKRTVSSFTIRSRGHNRTSSNDTSISTMPPPSYRTCTQHSMDETDDEGSGVFHSFPTSRPSSSGSTTPVEKDDGDCAVRQKFAKQGYHLLIQASQELDSSAANVGYSRKLYVDGLEYLLRGLPADLTIEEQLSLRAALPPLLHPGVEDEQTVVVATGEQSVIDPERASALPSTLQCLVSWITFRIFLMVSFFLSYTQLLLQTAYRYDREWKISDRLLAQGLIAADHVGKQTMSLASNVCAMNDGKVGEAVKDVGKWWIQGVSGGLYEGIGEGMEAVGLRSSTSRMKMIKVEKKNNL